MKTTRENIANVGTASVAQVINQQGGTVIVNPPAQPVRGGRKWVRRWHLFGLWFAVSNGRLKKRDERRFSGGWRQYRKHKETLYERQQGQCPHCGREIPYRLMELHHILPYGRFPSLRDTLENEVMLCHQCHKEVHCDPWLNIRLMEAKAKELGIDLGEVYGNRP